jgi:hypothetical protein
MIFASRVVALDDSSAFHVAGVRQPIHSSIMLIETTKLIGVTETARRLNCSEQQARRIKELEPVVIDGRRYFDVDRVAAVAAERARSTK